MKIVGQYSFNDGLSYINRNHHELLNEVTQVIEMVDANTCKTKISAEKTMKNKLLYSPSDLNKAFKNQFAKFNDWNNHKEKCRYSDKYYVNDYNPSKTTRGAYRDMDFVKDNLGVEVQFGKYSFMVYNVCAKMTIFKNLRVIDSGIEIVPIKNLAQNMSTGVSYFEQFVWDLETRGVSNIDIPVLVLGVNV